MTEKDINRKGYIATKEQLENLKKLSEAMTGFEVAYGEELLVTSGLRTVQDQERINSSNPNSAHISGEAVDVSDPDNSIWGFIVGNLPILQSLGLYIENKTFPMRHVHFQIRKPRSGNRIFIP